MKSNSRAPDGSGEDTDENSMPPARTGGSANAGSERPMSEGPLSPSAQQLLHRLTTNVEGPPESERQAELAHASDPAGAVLLRRWWLVLGGALVVAAITYAVSKTVPATYASSAEAVVLVTGTNVNDTTLGANNLAAQYAQLVNSSVVISAADRLLKPPGSIPTSAVTGGAVSAQNLVSIQATASSPQQAQARAAAVTTAFIEYVTYQVSRQATHYQQTTAAQLRPIDVEIASTQAKLKRSPTTARFALQQTLDTLLGQRASAQANIAESSVAGRPSVQLASQAGLGGQTAPKPTLYAVVGFVIGLLIIARLVVYNSGRRRPVSSGKAA